MNLELPFNSQLARLKQPVIETLTQIQPHGVLLVLSEPGLKVLQASRNTETIIGRPVEQILGQSLEEVLDSFRPTQASFGPRRPRDGQPSQSLDSAAR